jgi:hypothetical protein
MCERGNLDNDGGVSYVSACEVWATAKEKATPAGCSNELATSRHGEMANAVIVHCHQLRSPTRFPGPASSRPRLPEALLVLRPCGSHRRLRGVAPRGCGATCRAVTLRGCPARARTAAWATYEAAYASRDARDAGLVDAGWILYSATLSGCTYQIRYIQQQFLDTITMPSLQF